CWWKLASLSATALILSGFATEVPPYFCTIRAISHCRLLKEEMRQHCNIFASTYENITCVQTPMSSHFLMPLAMLLDYCRLLEPCQGDRRLCHRFVLPRGELNHLRDTV